MQFLAAKSLCTNLLLDKYSIPLATSAHIVTRFFVVQPYMNTKSRKYIHWLAFIMLTSGRIDVFVG